MVPFCPFLSRALQTSLSPLTRPIQKFGFSMVFKSMLSLAFNPRVITGTVARGLLSSGLNRSIPDDHTPHDISVFLPLLAWAFLITLLRASVMVLQTSSLTSSTWTGSLSSWSDIISYRMLINNTFCLILFKILRLINQWFIPSCLSLICFSFKASLRARGSIILLTGLV
jgi:hypothetical protein